MTPIGHRRDLALATGARSKCFRALTPGWRTRISRSAPPACRTSCRAAARPVPGARSDCDQSCARTDRKPRLAQGAAVGPAHFEKVLPSSVLPSDQLPIAACGEGRPASGSGNLELLEVRLAEGGRRGGLRTARRSTFGGCHRRCTFRRGDTVFRAACDVRRHHPCRAPRGACGAVGACTKLKNLTRSSICCDCCSSAFAAAAFCSTSAESAA